MLQNLHVKNLALIQEAEIDFQNGLNILTGETGAGKSLLLGGVSLALGGRYQGELLREGSTEGLAELVFLVEKERQKQALEELGIVPDNGQVILTRKLFQGKSVSRINGETVPISKLKAAAAVLIDIHGQHEHQSLLYKKNHLSILDAYGKETILPKKDAYQKAYGKWMAKKKELEKNQLDEVAREKEVDFLRFEIGEIKKAQLEEGEDSLLEVRFKKMDAGQKIGSLVGDAYLYLDSKREGAGSLADRALHNLLDAGRYDEDLSQLIHQMEDVSNLLNEVTMEVATYLEDLEFSSEEYEEVVERLNTINHLKKRYGGSIAEILQLLRKKEERLALLEEYDVYLGKQRKELARLEQEVGKKGEELTLERKKQGKKMAREIQEGLAELNFLDARFNLSFKKDAFSIQGQDEMEFMIGLNPGEPIRPLIEVASGGELSRIMLVIKTVLAEKDAVETMIFDEIDVGISGRTAQKVSEMLRELGTKRQVICITHLAQIAAMADAHYQIQKQVVKNKTHTNVKLLSRRESIEELARILGGAKITQAVYENAAEMKQLAQNSFPRN